ncbi:MAG: hypothetical protein H6Q20_1230 [Bacteroidetes bacterium]|jgi:hypothetical protein|nr:hypothetical protein [Bacteroidota bacterium]
MKKQKQISNDTNTQPVKEEGWFSRNIIAYIITGAVILVTVYIAWYSLNKGPTNASGFRDMSFVGQTLIPLWSTWMGTVLAFYFGKANFEAGSKSMKEAMKAQTPEDKFAEQMVKNVMLNVDSIVYLKYEEELNSPIADILKYDRFKPYNRYAVFDNNNVVKFMIHRGLFYQYIYVRTTEPDQEGNLAESNKLTLKDLIESPDERFKTPLQRGIVFINIEANLLEAKHKMDAVDECEDVFITQNGKPTESVLGLITNNRIMELAKV